MKEGHEGRREGGREGGRERAPGGAPRAISPSSCVRDHCASPQTQCTTLSSVSVSVSVIVIVIVIVSVSVSVSVKVTCASPQTQCTTPPGGPRGVRLAGLSCLPSPPFSRTICHGVSVSVM